MLKKFLLIIAISLSVPVSVYAEASQQQDFHTDGKTWQINVPDGYQLELLAEMPSPRTLVFADDGALIIGSLNEKIYRLLPPYNKVSVFATLWGSNHHGVTLRDNQVWVTSSDAVYSIPYRPQTAAYTPKDFTRIIDLPAKNGGHSSRTIKVGPDNQLYISVGISGNCSDEYMGMGYDFEDQRGGVFMLNENTHMPGMPKTLDVFANGLRNPVGFDWHPRTSVMYASNHGPDHLGYQHPAEYFSQLMPDSFHGMPWFWFDGKQMRPDDCISSKPPRTDPTLPSATFPARNGPMDVAFIPEGALDEAWEYDALVALHGSWGTLPDGRFFGKPETRRPPWIARVVFEQGKAADVVALIEGFQNDEGRRLARPVGLAFGKDGALYFTSDGGEVEGLFRLQKNN